MAVVGEVILDEQVGKKIDLIVLASHGQSGILRQLIGSVADKVVRGAKCLVLLAKSYFIMKRYLLAAGLCGLPHGRGVALCGGLPGRL